MESEKEFKSLIPALKMTGEADSVLEELADDLETIDEMSSEVVEEKAYAFFYSDYEAFRYLMNYEITDWDDAIEDGCTDVMSVASWYLNDEVMRGLAKIKKIMKGEKK